MSSKDTKERILQAALAEFCDHGYAGANIARIVASAACNVRMIYHYYDNKDGLYRACLERVYAELRESEDKLHFWDSAPSEGIAQLTRFTFDYMWNNPQFPRMMLNENLNEGRFVREITSVNSRSRPLLEHIGLLLERGVETGEFKRRQKPLDVYLTILALSFIHISNLHTLMATFSFDARSPEFLHRRRDQAVDIVLAHLRGA
ncbi:TetR/AcrR family transcriptional regulator [Aquamicrobium sp. LC103]|uniref:TetR/AcrR family transcriptional regulator n=1 Tax=Aquamicrobium sp. LC103 TaxID=1120658 RepID=UPI00069C1BA8|nr:TetR/AcrR family transcriptional regulator [Aquamicrobium sp. LC103]